MNGSFLEEIRDWEKLVTPAFVYDERQLFEDIALARSAIGHRGTRLFFALKSFSVEAAVSLIGDRVDGLHASSPFEVRLARRVLEAGKDVHLTSPALTAKEIEQVGSLCEFITFNSISQWRRLKDCIPQQVRCGLRVNPDLPLVEDDRYNPCRAYSKLGAELIHVRRLLHRSPDLFRSLSGLLIHTNCDATDFHPLLKTVQFLDAHLQELLFRLDWINLGGGYLFFGPRNLEALREAIGLLRGKYGLQVIFEPGAAIVRRAGSLVASVVDLFSSNGRNIAILDTSVNHMPEVFEYQFEPDVLGVVAGAPYHYFLAGATCLAGDVFGEYAFERPLRVGSRVVFENMGAYTLVKWNMFNGINLPRIYALTVSGDLVLKKRFTFDDFLTRCGRS